MLYYMTSIFGISAMNMKDHKLMTICGVFSQDSGLLVGIDDVLKLSVQFLHESEWN